MFWLKTIEHSRFTKGGNNFEMRRIYTCTELSMIVVEKLLGLMLWSEVVGEMYRLLNLASLASQWSCPIFFFPCLFL